MLSEVSRAERWLFGIAVGICNHTGHNARAPLSSHHWVQATVFGPVFCPELVFFEADRFPRFGDGAAADSVEDELAPELVFGAELVLFPRSLTS